MTDQTTAEQNYDRVMNGNPTDSEEYVQEVLDELANHESRLDLGDEEVRCVLAVLDDLGVGPKVATTRFERLASAHEATRGASVNTVDLTLSGDPLDDAFAGDKTPAARLRAAAAALRDRERSACDLDEHCEHPFHCSTILPLAALLENAAARWERDVLLDRPESPEMTPTNPLAWWCGTCQGAIASRDYSDDERCVCGWWTESIALAEAVLAAAAVSE